MISTTNTDSDRRFGPTLKILLISFAILFWEVMMIRWLSAEVRIFSYFHNLVLLFCFFGIGLGCALAKRNIYPILSFITMIALVAWVELGQYVPGFELKSLSAKLSLATDFSIWYRPPATISSTTLANNRVAISN